METNVNYTIVGAFVIVLTTAIILSIIWLSSGLSTQTYTTYQVDMKEAVNGLSIDAAVQYNGVNVGTVKSIAINRKNIQFVTLLLRIKSDTPITFGTRAKLDVKALSGLASIALLDKGTDMRPLIAFKEQPYPVIQTTPSNLLRLDSALTQLSDSFRKISNSVESLLDQENLRAIKETLLNLRIVSTTLATSAPQMEIFLRNAAKSSKQLPTLIDSSANAMQVIQMQTLPVTNQAIENLNSMSRDLSALSAEIKQNPSVLIRGKTPPTLGPGER